MQYVRVPLGLLWVACDQKCFNWIKRRHTFCTQQKVKCVPGRMLSHFWRTRKKTDSFRKDFSAGQALIRICSFASVKTNVYLLLGCFNQHKQIICQIDTPIFCTVWFVRVVDVLKNCANSSRPSRPASAPSGGNSKASARVEALNGVLVFVWPGAPDPMKCKKWHLIAQRKTYN